MGRQCDSLDKRKEKDMSADCPLGKLMLRFRFYPLEFTRQTVSVCQPPPLCVYVLTMLLLFFQKKKKSKCGYSILTCLV